MGPRYLRGRTRRVRRYTLMGLVLLGLLAPAGWATAGDSSRPYIVIFDPDAVGSAAAAGDLPGDGRRLGFSRLAAPTTLRAASGGGRQVDGQRVVDHVRQIAARSRVRVDSVYASALGGFAAQLTPAQLRSIAGDPAVNAIMPDVPVELDDVTAGDEAGAVHSTANPSVSVPAGIRRIGARSPRVTSFMNRGRSINADVAILDTGIERDHPDLNVVGGYNCTRGKPDKWDDTEGHGTHVAGIVGALDNRVGVVGVAPGVRLWSVKVLDSEGRGFMSWIVCGIDWVTAQRDPDAPSRPLIEVANMSMSFTLSGADDRDCGAPGHDAVHQAICRSVAAGTVYVAAAGNNSRDARRNRPAAYDEVITVSALADYDGRGGGRGESSDSCPYWSPERDDAFAAFSNYGPDVDLIAPGKCVLSTYMGRRYAWMSGTSMAAPHVSGAAAIYRAMFPRATPAQVRLALLAVATLDWRTNTDPDGGEPERAVWIGQFRTMPDFSIEAAPLTDTARPGSQLAIAVGLARLGGFDDPITLSLVDPPAGFSAEPVVARQRSGTLIVEVGRTTRAGRYSLTLGARSGDVVHGVSVEIAVRRNAPPTNATGDQTAPRAPSVNLRSIDTTIGLGQLELPTAYVGNGGRLWVRGGVSGSIVLDVTSRDPESGIAANRFTITGGDGWQAEWVGDSTAGVLRVDYGPRGAPAELLVSSVNGAGLESAATVGQLVRDVNAPPAVEWASLPSGETRRTGARTFRLNWAAGADDDSGLANRLLMHRYRAPLGPDGSFSPNGFSADGEYRLVPDGTPETDLEPGYCYVWAVRALDNVGNASEAAVSGYLVVERGGR